MPDHVYHRWTTVLLLIAVVLLAARCSTSLEAPRGPSTHVDGGSLEVSP